MLRRSKITPVNNVTRTMNLIKSRVVLMQGGSFLLAKFRVADYTCAREVLHFGNEKITSRLLVAVQRLLVK